MRPLPIAALAGLLCSSWAAGQPALYITTDAGTSSGTTVTKINAGWASGTITGATFATLPGAIQGRGMAFGPDGNFYASTWDGNYVGVVPPTGGTAIVFASDPLIRGPEQIAWGPDGDLYVANMRLNTVARVTPGGQVSTFASGFSAPRGLAFGPDGNLYVSNSTANSISKVTPDGQVSLFYTGGLNDPNGLAFDASGDLLVADTNSGAVRFISPAGQLVSSRFLPITTFGTADPYGVAVDPAGEIAVAEDFGGQIVLLNSSGQIVRQLQFTNPFFVMFQPVPEPSALALAAVGGAGVALRRRWPRRGR